MERLVRISLPDGLVDGNLVIPAGATAIALFAHGSGSSRHSPRNRAVARELQRAGLATLLVDLLTAREDAADQGTGRFRFDIGLLASRLVSATKWLSDDEETAALRVGYFGASTGAAAALVAAVQLPAVVGAVVSRGGRPDLAAAALSSVKAPTLLIVGGADTAVIEVNRFAFERLAGRKELVVIPGATHLFEEPGALEEVARRAADWFREYLAASGAAERRPNPARR
jgi:dienelactone hydrolase